MSPSIVFGRFRIDLDRRQLLRGDAPIELRRKAFDVLRHLCERPDTLVTNDELLDAAWPGVAVTPQTLTNVIQEIRSALGDRADAPRWIHTVRGRGHVFRPSAADAVATLEESIVVGRARELARLAAVAAHAFHGEPRVVFVTGESGIGKTTLVETFLGSRDDDVRCARGACLEQHGPMEGFLPFLSAFDAFAVGPARREVAAVLRRTAPAWLMRLPSLLRPDERLRLQPSLVGATATRMLREGLDAMRALADLYPLVVLVEDLHWSDRATLDLLAALARAAGPWRLCVLATFRPSDATLREHPVARLAAELVREARAVEIPLGPFPVAAVAAYLAARLGGAPPPALAPRLEALSAGNPLFLRALVDELLATEAFAAVDGVRRLADDAAHVLDELPESLRVFVAGEAARLPARLRRVVEAASVLGDHALVPDLATAVARPVPEVAEDCEQLAGVGRLFRRIGDASWHDGTSVGRYAFPHASHRRIIHDGIAAHDRISLHRRLAEGLPATYGVAAPTIAARLATHCEQGGLAARAVDWHELAAETAEARFAYAEAADHLAAARDRLDAAAGPGGDQSARAGTLSLRLGETLVLAHGYSQPAIEATYARALAIFERTKDPLGIFTAEIGLALVDMTRARHRSARMRTVRLRTIAAGDAALTAIACCWAGFASSALGELECARHELEAGLATDVDPAVPRNFSIQRTLRSQLALVETVRGEHAAAGRIEADALARSRRHGAVSEIVHAALLAAERAVFAGDTTAADRVAGAIAIADGNGLVSYLALLRCYEAALRPAWPVERRIGTMRDALADRERLGDRWHHGLLLGLLADAHLEAGAMGEARTAVEDALRHVAATDERYYEAELYRLRAECGAAGRSSEATWWLERAVEVARAQGAALWEARARARLAAGRRRRRSG